MFYYLLDVIKHLDDGSVVLFFEELVDIEIDVTTKLVYLLAVLIEHLLVGFY
jgi:hypothetical protein